MQEADVSVQGSFKIPVEFKEGISHFDATEIEKVIENVDGKQAA